MDDSEQPPARYFCKRSCIVRSSSIHEISCKNGLLNEEERTVFVKCTYSKSGLLIRTNTCEQQTLMMSGFRTQYTRLNSGDDPEEDLPPQGFQIGTRGLEEIEKGNLCPAPNKFIIRNVVQVHNEF